MPNINPPKFTYWDTVTDVLTVGTEELNRKLIFRDCLFFHLGVHVGSCTYTQLQLTSSTHWLLFSASMCVCVCVCVCLFEMKLAT